MRSQSVSQELPAVGPRSRQPPPPPPGSNQPTGPAASMRTAASLPALSTTLPSLLRRRQPRAAAPVHAAAPRHLGRPRCMPSATRCPRAGGDLRAAVSRSSRIGPAFHETALQVPSAARPEGVRTWSHRSRSPISTNRPAPCTLAATIAASKAASAAPMLPKSMAALPSGHSGERGGMCGWNNRVW